MKRVNKAVFGKVRPIDHDYQPPEVWQPYNAAEAALSLEPSTLEHRELLEHAVEELGPLLKLTEKGAPHRLRCLIRDREVRHESMREVVDSAKEVADHDKRIERMKRRMFAANTKETQFPEAEICARQKPSKKRKAKPSVFLSDKQRKDAKKNFNSKESTLASAIDAIKDKKEEGDARESLERNSIECPNFLFSPTSDHTSPGQGEAGKSNRQEIFGIKGAFKHEGPLPTLTASAARDATQLRSRGAAKPRTFRMGDSKEASRAKHRGNA